jgi:hypothetical protein
LIIRIFNSRLPGSRKGRKVDYESLFINERNFPYQLMVAAPISATAVTFFRIVPSRLGSQY